MDDSFSFGYWIRRRRKALDLTQEDLARQVGCATVTIRKIESDALRPSRQIAERLAECLAIPSEECAAFIQAARAELVVDRLATPPAPRLTPPPERRPKERQPRPQALKGYELGEQLGAGGFGAVYRAVQPGVGRAVAIKVIRPDYANQPEFIRRFEAEAQLVARLEHPQIVPLYDYWRESDGAYLVMRYMRGGSLETALRDGPWALARSTRLLDEIGAALAFAHRHGIVHRDLKPANILLDEDGHAYLADFGIAKDLRIEQEVGETQPGVVVGSPAYLSPEQLRDEPLTPRSDLYSLGVLLYEVLTGEHPFANLPPAERLYQQLHAPLPPLQVQRPDLPDMVNFVIQRATAKAPDDRYPDVVSLVVDLQRAIASGNGPMPTWAHKQATAPDVIPVAADAGAATVAAEHAITLTDLAVVENPYKGLRAFAEADAADFFGREALIQRLLERLAAPSLDPSPAAEGVSEARFLAVVGPSGSGKSSVVRAGLIPALRRGGLPGSEDWFIVEALPGAHPLEELEAALLRIAVNPPESLLGQLREDERGLARAVKRILPADPAIELVLIIDQFEELFTLTQDEAVRAHLLASLCAAVLDPHSRVWVIVTLRADFYDRPLLYGGFGELIRQRTEVVLPLAPDELERAITGPAQRIGVALEPELVVAVGDDVGAQPGTLPLLQYALTELFERSVNRGEVTSPLLTLAAYRDSGAVRGALARRADEVYSVLDADGQEATQQLFLRLITLGEGVEDTRRRVLRSELESVVRRPWSVATGDDQRTTDNRQRTTDNVIDRYGRARLLSFDHDPLTRGPTVEVAHEALLREWGRLRAWLDASRADIRLQRLLATAAAEWIAAQRDPSYLLSGARLAQFEGWVAQTGLALTQDERGFLETSLAERAQRADAERDRQQRELETAQQLAATEQRRADEQSRAAGRLRRRAVFLASALALALIAAIAAGVFANRSAAQQAIAQENFAHAETLRLAAQATNVVDRERNGELAALLAIRSLRIAYSTQGDAALLPAITLGFTLRTFAGHTDHVVTVAFSPDGKYALSASDDTTVRLWDVATGQEVRRFTGHTDHVWAAIFSPDGKYVLSCGKDKTARLWDMATGQQLRLFDHPDKVQDVAFSPDGKSILTSSNDGMVRLWDMATGQQLRLFSGHTDVVTGVAFSPDGKYALSGSLDSTARLWDVATGQQLRLFSGHTDGVQSVAFSPDGKQVLTSSNDKTARLWDAATGRQLRLFAHPDYVWPAIFSPDGKYVLTGNEDGATRLWDAATGQQLRLFSGHSGNGGGAAFSPDGRYILTGSDIMVRLWDAQAQTEPRAFTGHTDQVHSVAFSPDGKQVLTGSWDQTARLWDAQTGQQLRLFSGHTEWVNWAVFSPDGKQVLTGSNDKTARLWDAQTGQQLRLFSGHSDGISMAIFSPDGKQVLTGSWDQTARLWDAATGQQLRLFTGHTDGIQSVAFSPDGKYILTGSNDKTAGLWDAATGRQLRLFSGHTDVVTGVAFSPDGKSVLTGSLDGTARLWDAQTGQQLRLFNGHTGSVGAVVFSADGKYILTGSYDTIAVLWDAATGQQLRLFSGHSGLGAGVAFSPDGKSVLTGSADGMPRLWRVDMQDVIRFACALLPRDFTDEERATYNITDNAPTCSKP